MNGALEQRNKEVSEKFNSLPFEERKKIHIFLANQQLTTIEQIKNKLHTNYIRQRDELTDWQNNILRDMER